MSSSLPKLEDYAFIYFVCEGTNEEYIIHWMHESRALKLRDNQYSLQFCRCRTPKGRQRLSQEIKELDYGGPVTAGMCNCMKHGYRAKVFILYNPNNRHEGGNWYMLDYRYTPDAGPEVGIWETDEHDNQKSIIDTFPIPGKQITAENLERFIDEFNWKSYNHQKHPESY